jgi:ATP-dependent Lon protease
MASGVELDLDDVTANWVRAERDRQYQRDEDERREELRRQQTQRTNDAAEERVRQTLDSRAQRKPSRRQPKAGWYRVLPKLQEMAQALEDHAVERSADKDVNQKRVQVFERLLKLGPDRRVGMPKDWRQAVDEMEAALPHFRAPIRSIRNALALAEVTKTAPRIAPQLLLGPPGVGKTHFTHRVAELLGTPQGTIQFDQPSAGAQLRGSDKYWSNTEPGLLFNLVCLGDYANPVILLDEMDKACDGARTGNMNPLAQLHGALERETAKRLVDVSVEVEFDSSLVTYIGTANTHLGIGAPILSRMEVHVIQPPNRDEAIGIAAAIAQSTLKRLGLQERMCFERQALCLFAQMSPRLMARAAEKAVAAAVASGRHRIGEWELWQEVEGGDQALH